MAWKKTAADRKRDTAVYQDPEYRRNRPLAMQRDKWRCQLRYEGCAGAASQCDHKKSAAEGGTSELSNLQAVCKPCHGKRTARQGGGFRAGQQADPEPRPRTGW